MLNEVDIRFSPTAYKNIEGDGWEQMFSIFTTITPVFRCLSLNSGASRRDEMREKLNSWPRRNLFNWITTPVFRCHCPLPLGQREWGGAESPVVVSLSFPPLPAVSLCRVAGLVECLRFRPVLNPFFLYLLCL